MPSLIRFVYIKYGILITFILLILIYYFIFLNFANKIFIKNYDYKFGNFQIDKDNNVPENFEREILDQIKYRFKGYTLIQINELYFINGLIRKYRPKKVLEIGVCSGGVSATILNAIKDIDGAKLFSCDLEKKHYIHSDFEVGYVAKNFFPELLDKWKLYTGNTTAAFIEEIGGKIDFVFIDTAHVMPGEVLNIIEILPFLNKKAIVAFDDINHHARNATTYLKYFYSCNNLLIQQNLILPNKLKQ